MRALLYVSVFLVACGDKEADDSVDSASATDLDGDGFSTPVDCDDGDPAVNPLAVEVCDGVDQDCDSSVDEGVLIDIFADVDGDGFGDPATATQACGTTEGRVLDHTDCDDADATVFPGAEEVCDDGVVNDCDGTLEDAMAGCVRAGAYGLDDADAVLRGEGGSFSFSIASAGDVNADGVGDVVVGAPHLAYTSAQQGAAFLFYGPISGEVQAADADARIDGTAYEPELATDVLGPGDLNGDGYDDLVVSALHSRLTLNGGDVAGSVYVFHGPLSGVLGQGDADVELRLTTEHDHFGYFLGSGDLNGDGAVDLVGSAPWTASLGGEALGVFYGPFPAASTERQADLILRNNRTESLPGIAIAVGDLDGDGQDDLATGVLSDAGTGGVEIVYGPLPTGQLDITAADVSVFSAVPDVLGHAVVIAGDMDGDGYNDLAAGAHRSATNGRASGGAWVLPGPLTASGEVSALASGVVLGEASDDNAGEYLAAGGDTDGDGLSDLVVSARWADTTVVDGGRVYLVHGPVSGAASLGDASLILSGEVASATAGLDVALGDLDGDPWPELLIGSLGEDGAGAVHIFNGRGY
ncbi:MAG: FG-GAP repeat protein [Alphaproteobacteria bacterium]|nr:FG-GAP repeat protein [Alphaproteobacteria bacterium]